MPSIKKRLILFLFFFSSYSFANDKLLKLIKCPIGTEKKLQESPYSKAKRLYCRKQQNKKWIPHGPEILWDQNGEINIKRNYIEGSLIETKAKKIDSKTIAVKNAIIKNDQMICKWLKERNSIECSEFILDLINTNLNKAKGLIQIGGIKFKEKIIDFSIYKKSLCSLIKKGDFFVECFYFYKVKNKFQIDTLYKIEIPPNPTKILTGKNSGCVFYKKGHFLCWNHKGQDMISDQKIVEVKAAILSTQYNEKTEKNEKYVKTLIPNFISFGSPLEKEDYLCLQFSEHKPRCKALSLKNTKSIFITDKDELNIDTLSGISIGHNLTCGLDENGKIYCWDIKNNSEIYKVPYNKKVLSIKVFNKKNVCGILENKLVECWDMANFQKTFKLTPWRIKSSGPAKNIWAGPSYICHETDKLIIECSGQTKNAYWEGIL